MHRTGDRLRLLLPLGYPGKARRELLGHPVLAAVATRPWAMPVQIALAWLLDLAPNILLILATRVSGTRVSLI